MIFLRNLLESDLSCTWEDIEDYMLHGDGNLPPHIETIIFDWIHERMVDYDPGSFSKDVYDNDRHFEMAFGLLENIYKRQGLRGVRIALKKPPITIN